MKKIMIVDDDKETTDLLESFLKAQGYEPIAVNDSTVAFEAANAALPDMFLLDLMIKLQKSPSQLIECLYSLVGPHYYDRIDIQLPAEQREAALARIKSSSPQKIAGLKVTHIDTLDGFRYILEDGGWLLIRFSGTEPLNRIYTETTDEHKVQALLADGRKLVGL